MMYTCNLDAFCRLVALLQYYYFIADDGAADAGKQGHETECNGTGEAKVSNADHRVNQ